MFRDKNQPSLVARSNVQAPIRNGVAEGEYILVEKGGGHKSFQ